MEGKYRILPELFFTFLKIGLFTFGGGYAMIPLIEREVVGGKGWVSEEDILEIIAISESTPGPIAINAATFVGFRVCGFWGAFAATLGTVLPSFFIILALSFVIRQFENLRAVKYAFFGIRAGVLALIVKAFWTMYRQCPKGKVSYVIAGGAFICVALFHVNVLYVLTGCALFGLFASWAAERSDRA